MLHGLVLRKVPMSTRVREILEINSLTSLRAFAALYVLSMHFDGAFGPITYPIHYFSPILSSGYIGVDMFFILSGFIMYLIYERSLKNITKTQVRKFLIARFARIYPIHLFTLSIWLLIMVIVTAGQSQPTPHGGFYSQENTIFSFLTNLLLIHSWGIHDKMTWNGISWSISAEWFAYLLFPALVYALRPVTSSRAALSVATAAFVVLVAFVESYGSLDVGVNYGLLRIACEFVIGMCVFRIYKNINSLNLSAPLIDVMIILCIGAVFLVIQFRIADIASVPAIAAIIGLAALERGWVAGILSWSLLVYLGRISYSIYMVHVLVRTAYVEFAKPHVGALLAESYPLSAAVTAIMVALTVGVAAFTFKFVENPARVAIRRRFG